MASYAIQFADVDQHSPRNGQHAPVSSGAAFVEHYGDELIVSHSEVDTDSDMVAACIDALAIGDSVKIEGAWGEVITVERIA